MAPCLCVCLFACQGSKSLPPHRSYHSISRHCCSEHGTVPTRPKSQGEITKVCGVAWCVRGCVRVCTCQLSSTRTSDGALTGVLGQMISVLGLWLDKVGPYLLTRCRPCDRDVLIAPSGRKRTIDRSRIGRAICNGSGDEHSDDDELGNEEARVRNFHEWVRRYGNGRTRWYDEYMLRFVIKLRNTIPYNPEVRVNLTKQARSQRRRRRRRWRRRTLSSSANVSPLMSGWRSLSK